MVSKNLKKKQLLCVGTNQKRLIFLKFLFTISLNSAAGILVVTQGGYASKMFLTRPHEKRRELRHRRGQNATNRGAAPLLEFLRYVGPY